MPTPESPFPIDAAERPLRFDAVASTPAELIRPELVRLARERRDEADELLAALARARFQLERLAADEAVGDGAAAREVAGLVAADLGALLDRHGVAADDAEGRPWDDASRAALDLRGHTARNEVAAPRICHVERPAIYRRGRLIARGAVLIETPARD